MKVYIKVKEAIAHYNRVNRGKSKMNLEILGEKVFAGDKRVKSPLSGKHALTRWNVGEFNKQCTVIHLLIIAKETGYSLCDLVVEHE